MMAVPGLQSFGKSADLFGSCFQVLRVESFTLVEAKANVFCYEEGTLRADLKVSQSQK
jgi:hypothetical protein